MFLDDLSFIELNTSTVFDGSSSDFTLHNVNLSQLSTAYVFKLFDVTLELNNLNISPSSFLRSGFLMARSTNSTLLSVDISFNNENLNSLTGLGENYLFDLIGGLFIFKNSTVLNLCDNLAFLKSVIAFFETVDVINLNGSCVFNVVDSYLFLITFRLIPYNSILQPQALHDSLKSFQIHQNSHVSLLQESELLLDTISFFLNSSQLIVDDSVNISTTTLSLIAINSLFQNDIDLPNLQVLDLTSSTFESLSFIQVDVDFFWCSLCQILGNSSFEVDFLFDVNYGNFSSSIVVRESVTNSTVSGAVLLSDSFDFFRHVTLDDVSVSEFQSSTGTFTCHSDVLMRNDVTFSIIKVAFSQTLNIFLSDSHVFLHQHFDLQEFQILSGSGVIFDNTSNSGQIIPLPLIVFDQNLVLSSSSTVTLQLLNDTASTQVLVGSTLYLDGILEIEFDSFLTWSRNDFLLMESSKLIGQFVSSKNNVSVHF
ncbi:hypothetical protein GEMRC1_008806 [Eukaryota sp. GEM-RC1]